MTALADRILQRSRTHRENSDARSNARRVRDVRSKIKLTLTWYRTELNEAWKADNNKQKRKTPNAPLSKRLQALSVKSATLRRTIIHWYCATFLILTAATGRKKR